MTIRSFFAAVAFIGQQTEYTEHRTRDSERQAKQMYRIQYVYGHYQVYTVGGRFLFSADTEAEAMEELEALDA